MRSLLFAFALLSTSAAAAAAFDHAAWDGLLRAHVGPDSGLVDYAGLAGERRRLDAYLDSLADADLTKAGREEKVAFWLNAYNARMVALVLDHYPIRGDRPELPAASVLQVDGIFKTQRARFAGLDLSLDEIEHEYLRARFAEPRVHFALVCGAVSCPPLRAEAYSAERLDEQLADQARRFLGDRSKNEIDLDAGVARLSRIFEWFGEDFVPETEPSEAMRRRAGPQAAVLAFLAPLLAEDARRAALEGRLRVEFLPYDWTLNDLALARGGRP